MITSLPFQAIFIHPHTVTARAAHQNSLLEYSFLNVSSETHNNNVLFIEVYSIQRSVETILNPLP